MAKFETLYINKFEKNVNLLYERKIWIFSDEGLSLLDYTLPNMRLFLFYSSHINIFTEKDKRMMQEKS